VTGSASFEAWWTRPVEWLDAANARGNGWSRTGRADAADWPELGASGVLYVKRQQDYFCRPLWNLGRRTPTLRREKRALELCRRGGVTVPNVLGYAESGTRAVLLLEALPDAHTLVDAMTAAADAERHALLTRAIAAIVRLHQARIRHGALYPKHVLIAGNNAWLIDLEKARRVLSPAWAARRDVPQFLRHAPFMTDEEKGLVWEALVERGWVD
jgi:tRNA A-37 threonylcarbamoyl transferase component Bud32